MDLQVRVRIRKLSGDVVMDEMQEGDARVEDLKQRILEMYSIPPHKQHLMIHAGEPPLLGTERLYELHAPTRSRRATLHIQLGIDAEQLYQGPFGVGQEALWGVWEGMSNCSGPLDDYQGSWACSTECRPLVQSMFHDTRGFVINIAADLATDYYGHQFKLTVENGCVRLGDKHTHISSDGDLYILNERGHVMLLYRRQL